MKEQKKHYRESYEQLKQVKTEANFIEASIDKLKSQLVTCFESWYASTFETEEDIHQ